MPRNVMQVEGPSIFSVARGIPNSSQTCWKIARFLNQARAWFLKIDPVQIVCMCMCVCVRPRGY